MKTIDFSRVLFNALQFSGNDRNNISDETFQQFRDFCSTAMREAWETVQWTDVCRLKDFTITIDPVTNVGYFIPDAEASEILGVFSRNPQASTKAIELEYTLYDDGTNQRVIINNNISTGSYLYRKKCPDLNGDIYSPSTIYYAGSQIYFDSGSGTGTYTPVAGKPHTANFYICNVASTTAGQNPNNTPSAWTKIEIPYNFGNFMSWCACAYWYVSENMIQEAGVIEAKAKQILELEFDKLQNQQSQLGRINMYKTY